MSDETSAFTVLQRILGVLGVASIACTARPIGDDSEGADEADAASTETSEGGSSTETSSETTSDTEEEGVGPHFDLGGPKCSEFERLWIDVAMPDDCTWEEDQYTNHDIVCTLPYEGNSCDEVSFAPGCYLEAYECGFVQAGEVIRCGPFTSPEGACCYVIGGDCLVGRPFQVRDRARTAKLVSTAWTEAAMPDLATLDHETRAALADFWAREGLSEHASVASFARFTLQLMALGAPARLITASVRAGLDEIRHGSLCFGLASAYANAPVGPGSLDVRGCMDDEQLDPRTIALSLAREGCIAETVSTLLLIAARDRARDPAVRAGLAAIVEDELDHVLLAWEALAWMIGRDPALRGVLAQVFAQADRNVGFGAISELPSDTERMREHGHLTVAERRAIATDAIDRIIRPSARALLVQAESSRRDRDASVAG